jgi:hypothetical protein
MFKRIARRLLRGCAGSNARSIIQSFRFRRESFNVVESLNLVLNGPSLKHSIDEISQSARKCMVVNHFADFDYFEKLKPDYYIIQDSYFWQQGLLSHYVDKRLLTFKSLSEKATWPITLFLPSFADVEFVRGQIRNPNVRIVTYYANYLVGCRREFRSYIKPKKWLFYLWQHNVLAPPPENVLVGATYVAFLGGAKEVALYGADMSFFKGLKVDQKSNEVGILQSHFYGDEFRRHYKDKAGKTPTTMSYELEKWAKVFRVMCVLNDFYQSRGLRVVNLSSHSYLDAFPRSYGNSQH